MVLNGKLRIVLVEDDDAIREVLSKSLTNFGYEVYSFSKPTICPLQLERECRCSENQSCTDVILTDIEMPDLDGFQFVENIQNKNCKCRHVAIMSGWFSPEQIQRAKQLDCKLFTKPFMVKEFIEWLDGIESNIKPSRELCNWFQVND